MYCPICAVVTPDGMGHSCSATGVMKTGPKEPDVEALRTRLLNTAHEFTFKENDQLRAKVKELELQNGELRARVKELEEAPLNLPSAVEAKKAVAKVGELERLSSKMKKAIEGVLFWELRSVMTSLPALQIAFQELRRSSMTPEEYDKYLSERFPGGGLPMGDMV